MQQRICKPFYLTLEGSVSTILNKAQNSVVAAGCEARSEILKALCGEPVCDQKWPAIEF